MVAHLNLFSDSCAGLSLYQWLTGFIMRTGVSSRKWNKNHQLILAQGTLSCHFCSRFRIHVTYPFWREKCFIINQIGWGEYLQVWNQSEWIDRKRVFWAEVRISGKCKESSQNQHLTSLQGRCLFKNVSSLWLLSLTNNLEFQFSKMLSMENTCYHSVLSGGIDCITFPHYSCFPHLATALPKAECIFLPTNCGICYGNCFP